MKQLENKTMAGTVIEPVYRQNWHGEYSTGEYYEYELTHFTDQVCKDMQRMADRINRLPPIPWEATEEQRQAHELAVNTYAGIMQAIKDRQELLSRLYPRD